MHTPAQAAIFPSAMARHSDPPRLFCFGLGYCARRLAERCLARGWRVAGTVRAADQAESLERAGIEVVTFDGLGKSLAGTTHLLSSVPPDHLVDPERDSGFDSGRDPVLDRYGAEIAACRDLAWLGYLSTTGVYGDRAGGWVDEGSALRPTGARGLARVMAERAWLALHAAHGLPVQRFRLAGIYGPGRSALDAVRRGAARRIDKPGQVFSRIHVDDIVAVLEASIARPDPGQTYNVCDDRAAPPAEVIAHACRLLGVDPSPLVAFADAELSAMARSFYRDNKRVSNRRIKDQLGVRLAFPDYRAGLDALLAAGF